MKKLIVICTMLVLTACFANAVTINFTAGDIVSAIGSLSDSSNQWGLWAVRAMPIVTGGDYTITGGSTNQTGWGTSAPNGAFGAAPYTAANSVWFWDASGAEVSGNPANPLYVIIDQPANTFTSYFGNTVTAIGSTAQFSFSFTPGSGAAWTGEWQFVVDGSKYTLGTVLTPGTWVEDFFGGYTLSGGTPGGNLSGNMESGYLVPEPTTICLLTIGSLALIRKKK